MRRLRTRAVAVRIFCLVESPGGRGRSTGETRHRKTAGTGQQSTALHPFSQVQISPRIVSPIRRFLGFNWSDATQGGFGAGGGACERGGGLPGNSDRVFRNSCRREGVGIGHATQCYGCSPSSCQTDTQRTRLLSAAVRGFASMRTVAMPTTTASCASINSRAAVT